MEILDILSEQSARITDLWGSLERLHNKVALQSSLAQLSNNTPERGHLLHVLDSCTETEKYMTELLSHWEKELQPSIGLLQKEQENLLQWTNVTHATVMTLQEIVEERKHVREWKKTFIYAAAY